MTLGSTLKTGAAKQENLLSIGKFCLAKTGYQNVMWIFCLVNKFVKQYFLLSSSMKFCPGLCFHFDSLIISENTHNLHQVLPAFCLESLPFTLLWSRWSVVCRTALLVPSLVLALSIPLSLHWLSDLCKLLSPSSDRLSCDFDSEIRTCFRRDAGDFSCFGLSLVDPRLVLDVFCELPQPIITLWFGVVMSGSDMILDNNALAQRCSYSLHIHYASACKLCLILPQGKMNSSINFYLKIEKRKRKTFLSRIKPQKAKTPSVLLEFANITSRYHKSGKSSLNGWLHINIVHNNIWAPIKY